MFAVDPAEFVAARDALARQLKADGQRDEAAAVKALRRPPVPIWALNRVARNDGDAVQALLSTAADAQEAQDALLAGRGDRDALRDALAKRRTAMHDVVHRASDVIEQSGRSPAAQQRQVEDALNAVVASDALSEQLRNGELVDVADDEAHDDTPSLLGASVAPRATKKPAPVTDLAEARAAKQAAATLKEVDRLRKAADGAADAVEKARGAATEADAEVERVREELARAEANTQAAREAERAAERAHEEALDALQREQAKRP